MPTQLPKNKQLNKSSNKIAISKTNKQKKAESNSQDGTDFSNKINPSTAGPTPTPKVDSNTVAKE